MEHLLNIFAFISYLWACCDTCLHSINFRWTMAAHPYIFKSDDSVVDPLYSLQIWSPDSAGGRWQLIRAKPFLPSQDAATVSYSGHWYHSELIVVCWSPQTLNIRSAQHHLLFYKPSDAKIHPKSLKTSWCLLIIIITIIMMIPRYTHHVIWRRVDPPNPCYSLCYRWNAMMAP